MPHEPNTTLELSVNHATLLSTLKTLAETVLEQPVTFSDQPLSEQLDSMQRLSLMVAIEDHFEIIFEPEEEQEITGVQSLLKMIETKCQANSDTLVP